MFFSPFECFFVHKDEIAKWAIEMDGRFVHSCCWTRWLNGHEDDLQERLIQRKVLYSIVSNPGTTLVSENERIKCRIVLQDYSVGFLRWK